LLRLLLISQLNEQSSENEQGHGFVVSLGDAVTVGEILIVTFAFHFSEQLTRILREQCK
jgi:hypothetical protein